MWATGKWSATVKGQNFGPVEAKGYWSVIREGDDWNIRMLCFNSTPAPLQTHIFGRAASAAVQGRQLRRRDTVVFSTPVYCFGEL